LGRIVSIDYGSKRIGLAVTDPGAKIATGLDTVHTNEIWDYLKIYIAKEDVSCFVVGFPKDINNQPSDAAKYIGPFIKKLKKICPGIPVELVDERFTSKMAFQAMIDGGVKKMARRNKALVDKISATILLQSFLEQKKGGFV